ncbi:putative ATP-dependent RNA helicase [Operophtera brumata]|uniref:Putative ATP-dependent RNA helicase n=1 Tax=Operophtera brumata TaxID=104452 RepID=A0A0L7LSL3_OPEBR|nr:putative ATP-dependent RNA helicase [Operophtera brumata]
MTKLSLEAKGGYLPSWIMKADNWLEISFFGSRKQKEEPKELDDHPTLRVELQTVRLNSDSQKLDKGTNLGNRYWMERGNLIVQGGCDYSITTKPDIQTSEARLRAFALSKLENVEKALEILFMKYFRVDTQDKPEEVPSMPELLEMRSDEVAVLESIYETSFQVKENNIWSVKLNLDYLTKMYENKDVAKRKDNINYNQRNQRTKPKEVCKLFLKGPCRFGAKCKFLHEVHAEKKMADDSESSEKQNVTFELEIRLTEDSVYPYQPPLIFFKVENRKDIIPELTCLKVAARLLDEAKTLALDGIPSMYSLVELLNNEEDIINFIQFDTRTFLDPSEALFPQLMQDSSSSKEKLPSHYKKGLAPDKRLNVNFEEILRENREIAKRYFEKTENSRYTKMMSSRRKLPAWQKKNDILNALRKSQIVVISGETGCGKSTQVPQFILDHWLENMSKDGADHAEIVCTQPRRISAIGVADRVADERVEKTGQVVGYQAKDGADHAEAVCTRPRQISAIGVADRVADERVEKTCQVVGYQLKSVTHVIVDEVHERSEESDFLLLILRDLVKVRKDLRVILMSATLNAELFSTYFEKLELETCDIRAESAEPPKVSVRDENLTVGQMLARYPRCGKITCKNMYLMDTEKVKHVLTYVVNGNHKWPREGAILIFLPGIAEIMALHDQLAESHTFSPKEGAIPIFLPGIAEIMALHDQLAESHTFSPKNNTDVVPGVNYFVYGNKCPREGAILIFLPGIAEIMALIRNNTDVVPGVNYFVYGDQKCPREGAILIFLSGIAEIMALHDQLAESHAFSPKNNTDLVTGLNYVVYSSHKWPTEGAILIFLPGIAEIMALHDQLSESPEDNTDVVSGVNYFVYGNHKWPREGAILILLPGIAETMALHNQLAESHTFSPNEEQALVFKKTRPGTRKIVISTNIAETSVTIDDCVFVIDCGRMKEKRLSLDLVWVSRANAKQRKGRAGRVMPGVSVHLYTSHRYQHHLLEQPVPEIHRIPLEQLLLKIKILPLTAAENEHRWRPHPPARRRRTGQAARPNSARQTLGRLASRCSDREANAVRSYILLRGLGINSGCLPQPQKPVCGALWEEIDVRIGKLMLFGAIFCCVDSALTVAACLSHNSPFVAPFGKKTLLMLADIKHQLLGLLAAIGFVPDMPALRRKMRKDSVLSLTGEESFHMQAGGAIPRQPTPDELKFKTRSDGYVALHPSSVNSQVGYYPSPYLVYQEKVKTSRVFIRECSMVAEMLKTIRVELINLLEEKINDPGLNLLHHEKGNKIINTIVQIITKD